MMQVFVNGDPHIIAANATLADLIAQLGLDQTACATAVNEQFIARSQRAQKQLREHDQVMTFEPITGG
jgi:sulfur carrier protein